MIKRIASQANTYHFIVTADHGFIYRRNEVLESNKYSNVVQLNAVETSKRYLITDDDSITIPNTNEINVDKFFGSHYKVIAPWGYDLFKTQGAGIQYVHGGTSLQETIVPIIHVSELRSRTDIEVARPVSVRLKSITRKITNRSFTLEF